MQNQTPTKMKANSSGRDVIRIPNNEINKNWVSVSHTMWNRTDIGHTHNNYQTESEFFTIYDISTS